MLIGLATGRAGCWIACDILMGFNYDLDLMMQTKELVITWDAKKIKIVPVKITTLERIRVDDLWILYTYKI